MEKVKPVVELELYLVRHGQSKGNAGLVEEGASFTEINDVRLTELGVMQAKKAGKYLSDIEFDACFASGLIRTVQTANEIMSFQKEKKPLNILPIITEIGVNPDFPGRTLEEMKEVCSAAQMAEGFENAERLVVYSTHQEEPALYERAAKAIGYLRSKFNNGEKVLVAGHAAFNTVMIFHIMGYSASPVFDIEITNTGITHIVFYKVGTNRFGDIVFESINDTKHFCIPDEDVSDISVSKMIKENPENLDETARLLAQSMKKLHSEKSDGIDIKPSMVQKTDEIKHFITVEKWQKLRSVVTAVENSGTRLAIECTTNSAIRENGKIVFGKHKTEFSGYPVFDLGRLYESLVATSEIDRTVAMETLGFTYETAQRFWEKVIDIYFAGKEEDLISRAKDRAKLIAYFNIFYRLIKDENRNKEIFEYYKEKFIEYITKCGSLDFE